MHKMVLSLSLSGLLLMGCAPSEVGMSNPVPLPLLACLADPVPPDGAEARAVGVYILDLWAAGDDCRRKLAAITAWQEGH